MLSGDHVTETYIPPEGDSWRYEVARGSDVKKGDTVYFWSNVIGGFFGWGEVSEPTQQISYDVDRPISRRTRLVLRVRRMTHIDPPITPAIMSANRNLRRLVPDGFDDLYAVPLRPAQANYLNDFIRQHQLNSPKGSETRHWSFLENAPDITVQSILTFGDRTAEGRLVEGVTIAWDAIIDLIARDPDEIYKIDPQKLEEIVAGAYEKSGYIVELTPRSGDRGRDVVATLNGVGSIRIFDQIKRYKVMHPVTAEEVRALVGVISMAGNVSKGIVTTTSSFAPRILDDPDIKRLVPYRLELRPRESLIPWLVSKRR